MAITCAERIRLCIRKSCMTAFIVCNVCTGCAFQSSAALQWWLGAWGTSASNAPSHLSGIENTCSPTALCAWSRSSVGPSLEVSCLLQLGVAGPSWWSRYRGLMPDASWYAQRLAHYMFNVHVFCVFVAMRLFEIAVCPGRTGGKSECAQ